MNELMEAAQRHDEAFNAHREARQAAETKDVEVVLPGGVTLNGSEQEVGFVQAFWEALPDATVTWSNYIVRGDMVAIEGTLMGTHTGTLRSPQGEIAPSGKPVRFRYCTVKKILDGKVASEHLYFDQLEFLQQVGAL